MEIIDYLRVARRRLWVLVGVPVVATGIAAAVVLNAPQQYEGTAYVAAPALVGGIAAQQYTGQQAANQFVAAFSAAVTSPKVIDQVATDTGVAAGNLRDGLKVTQVGASSQLEIRYTATQQDTVTPVLSAASRRALTFLFSSQVDIATREVEAASADVTAATKAIGDWEKTYKVSQPDRLYQATLNEMANLRQQQLNMQAVGNGRGLTAVTEAIAAAQKRLDDIGPKLPDYQVLLAQRDAATSTLAQARQGLQSARAQIQAADPAQVTSVGAVEPVSRVAVLLRTVLPVAGAGVLIAVVLVAFLELLSRVRAARRAPVGVTSPGPAGAGAGVSLSGPTSAAPGVSLPGPTSAAPGVSLPGPTSAAPGATAPSVPTGPREETDRRRGGMTGGVGGPADRPYRHMNVAMVGGEPERPGRGVR